MSKYILKLTFCSDSEILPQCVNMSFLEEDSSLQIIKKGISEKLKVPVERLVLSLGCQVLSDNDLLSTLLTPEDPTEVFLLIQNKDINFNLPIVPQLPKAICKKISRKFGKANLVEKTKKPSVTAATATVANKPIKTKKPPAAAANVEIDELNSWECAYCTALNDNSVNLCDVCATSRPEVKKKEPVEKQADEPINPNEWECQFCQVLNEDRLNSCEVCLTPRPGGNKIRLSTNDKVKKAEEEYLEYERAQAQEIRRQLIESENLPYYTNPNEFDCPICLETVAPGEGIMLRSCTHEICRNCLAEQAKETDKFPLPCPHNTGDKDASECEGFVQHREIHAVLTEDDWTTFLQKECAAAESRTQNSFHCRTADCRGWVMYEDGVNRFKCQVCDRMNCITCKAQHEPLTCKDYQDDLRRRAARDDNARKDLELMEKMLREGEAMRCPECTVILQKMKGCDWIQCTMCKTEICWVTKGRRWGPKGKGDNTGGCKCRIGGKKCHPKCGNCH